MRKKRVEIVCYKTAAECLAAFHGCRVVDIPRCGYWVYYDRSGKQCRTSQKAALKNIRKHRCWGWCEDKRLLHLWIARNASPIEVISLIAHELGHCEKPYLRRDAEERKAAGFEGVAYAAMEAYLRFKKRPT